MKSANAILLTLGVVLLCGMPVFAQDKGPSEVAVDYSYIRAHANKSLVQPFNLNGAGGSYVYFFHNSIGVKAEFTGYGSTTQHYAATCSGEPCNLAVSGNLFTYAGGLEVKSRSSRWQPFGDLLFGGAHTNAYANLFQATGNTGASPSNNGFALIVGGGIDVGVSKNIALRLGEFDYLLMHFGNAALGGGNTSSFRYQAGVVFNF